MSSRRGFRTIATSACLDLPDGFIFCDGSGKGRTKIPLETQAVVCFAMYLIHVLLAIDRLRPFK